MHTLAVPRADAAPVSRRLALTALVAAAEAGHLAWEWSQGGIVSHHLLGDPAMPTVWNGWGLLVLPAIAWIASARLVGRPGHGGPLRRAAWLRLAGAMVAGIAMSVAFTVDRSDVAGGLLLAIALSGLAVRAYRVEYLLGFVLGMAYTFGAMIPTLIGGAIAIASAAVWFGPWRFVQHLARRSRQEPRALNRH